MLYLLLGWAIELGWDAATIAQIFERTHQKKSESRASAYRVNANARGGGSFVAGRITARRYEKIPGDHDAFNGKNKGGLPMYPCRVCGAEWSTLAEAEAWSGMAKSFAGRQAGMCGFKLLQVVDEAINPVLVGAGIEALYCGVGVAHGRVIVTKVGTHSTYDVKAFGNCVNRASKLAASACNTLIVTKTIRDWWPTSSGGTIRFQSTVTKEGIKGFKVLKGAPG